MFQLIGFWTALTFTIVPFFVVCFGILLLTLNGPWQQANGTNKDWPVINKFFKPFEDSDSDIHGGWFIVGIVYFIGNIAGVVVGWVDPRTTVFDLYTNWANHLAWPAFGILSIILSIKAFSKLAFYIFLLQSKLEKIKKL